MNEQNERTNESLYDAIERGFEREEENPSPEEMPTEEAPVEEAPVEEAPVEAMAEEAPAAETPAEYGAEPVEATATPAQDNTAMTMQTLLQMVSNQNAQIAQLQQQLQQQSGVMQQQNELATQTADAVTSQPAFELPTLNWNELQYMDSEDAQKALGDWQSAFANQVVARVQNDFAPIRQEYENKSRIAANEAAKAVLYKQADFQDFQGNDAQIERIIEATPAINGIEDPEQRYLLAGLIARGVNYQPAKAPSTDDIVRMATGNPEVMKALALKSAQEQQAKSGNVPTFTASSGLSSANAMPESRVKTREDLESRLNSRFGL